MSEKERALVLGAIVKRIGTLDMDSFDGRLLLQKWVYLLQAFGLFLGYRFKWYLYGPYSSELASDGFEISSLFHKIPKGRFAKKTSEKRFSDFRSFLDVGIDNPEWLELLASIHFLNKLYRSRNKEEIIKMVMKKQTYFTREKCEIAWNHLEQHGLLRR